MSSQGWDTHCFLEDWDEDSVTVNCNTSPPKSTGYSVLYIKPDVDSPVMAFARADRPSEDSYVPDPFYSFNSSGGGILVTGKD